MRVSGGQLASRLVPGIYTKYLSIQKRRQRERIDAALKLKGSRPVFVSCQLFSALEGRSFPLAAGTYKYDRFSSVARGAERLCRLAKLVANLDAKKRILEVSCGDGWFGSLLALSGHDVTLSDVTDWRHDQCRELPFFKFDVCSDTPPEYAAFDLVVAYNAAEHWPDPRSALRNLLSLCKPAGHVLLDFGPLFNSPWGLHAWSIRIPYPQFLFPRDFIERKVAETGVQDLGEHSTTLQPTNGWALAQFRALWQECGAEVISVIEDRDFRYLPFIEEFMPCFRGRGLDFDELTVNSIEVLLRRRQAHLQSAEDPKYAA